MSKVEQAMRLEILRSSIESRKRWYKKQRAMLSVDGSPENQAHITILTAHIETCDDLLIDIEKMSPVVNPIKTLLES